jgi:hypothetical protein
VRERNARQQNSKCFSIFLRFFYKPNLNLSRQRTEQLHGTNGGQIKGSNGCKAPPKIGEQLIPAARDQFPAAVVSGGDQNPAERGRGGGDQGPDRPDPDLIRASRENTAAATATAT